MYHSRANPQRLTCVKPIGSVNFEALFVIAPEFIKNTATLYIHESVKDRRCSPALATVGLDGHHPAAPAHGTPEDSPPNLMPNPGSCGWAGTWPIACLAWRGVGPVCRRQWAAPLHSPILPIDQLDVIRRIRCDESWCFRGCATVVGNGAILASRDLRTQPCLTYVSKYQSTLKLVIIW